MEPTSGPAPTGTGPVNLLVLCTANVCRSPMAQALLVDRLASAPVPATVTSAGLLGSGVAPPPEAVAALAPYGLDTSGHRSRHLEAADIEAADLVVGMARSHVREAVALVPEAWPRTFTLKELARRGSGTGPRRPGEDLAMWLARVGEGRVPSELLGEADVDDVRDPMGGDPAEYVATGALLVELVDRVVALAWPAG
ncbi:MAG: low molecular weight phosphatase family protein [Acidimicrobiales bacterium]